MDKVLFLGNEFSPQAYRAKKQYSFDYWEYRAFESRLLPKIDLDVQPFTFNRSFIKRYDPTNNIDVYREQQNLNTFAQLSISQNVMLTGATLYVNSSFNRLANFVDETVENYSTIPVRIGIVQPIMAFNELKWLNKTAALEYRKAQSEYLYHLQELNIRSVSLFFEWIQASNRVQIAEENDENTKKLYEIGKKRYPLGLLERDDFLNLELEMYRAGTDLARAKQDLQTVIADLQLFLDTPDLEEFVPDLPQVLSHLKIDLQEARDLAYENNPELLNTEIARLNAERNLDKTVKENRFELSLNASYGLNQQADSFAEAYSNFLDQQLLAVEFSMPLLDWGERKRKIKAARINRELSEIEIQQNINRIDQELQQIVNNFNIQEDLVVVALKSQRIARESYRIAEKRFVMGSLDLLRLVNARKTWQVASEEYINSLKTYWEYYYKLQKLTLYNFIEDTSLLFDLDTFLE